MSQAGHLRIRAEKAEAEVARLETENQQLREAARDVELVWRNLEVLGVTELGEHIEVLAKVRAASSEPEGEPK